MELLRRLFKREDLLSVSEYEQLRTIKKKAYFDKAKELMKLQGQDEALQEFGR